MTSFIDQNKNPRTFVRGFCSYSLDLLELSDFLLELSDLLLEPSDFPAELSGLLALDDVSEVLDDPDELSWLLELLLPSDALADASFPSLLGGRFNPDDDLWSVAYQPEPLNTMPAGVNTLRRLFLLHSGQRFNGSSVKDWWRSNCTPQLSQR